VPAEREIASEAEVLELVVAGIDLPQYIFSRRFKGFLFFDADICTSAPLISAVQAVAKVSNGLQSTVKVFNSANRQLLGCLNLTCDLPAEIKKMSEEMNASGYHGGLILVEAQKRWALYQKRPVDMGVFAFDGDQDLRPISTITNDYFVRHQDIALWLSGETQRDIDLVDGFGRNFLTELIKNYS
jgi:hypothetical protein